MFFPEIPKRKIKESSLGLYKDKVIIVGIDIPTTSVVRNVITSNGVDVRGLNGVYGLKIPYLTAKDILATFKPASPHTFFAVEAPETVYATIDNKMGATILTTPYATKRIPYTVGSKQFKTEIGLGNTRTPVFVLGDYMVNLEESEASKWGYSTEEVKEPVKIYSILDYAKGVAFISERFLSGLVLNGMLGLVNAKVVTGEHAPYIAGINSNIPVLETEVFSNDKVGSLADKDYSDGNAFAVKNNDLNHDKYKHKVLSKYIRNYIAGRYSPYRFHAKLTKSSSAYKERVNKEVDVLFREVFGKLYPQHTRLYSEKYKHVPIGFALEYFIVLFLADKKGYKSKYPTSEAVNTADSKYYSKNNPASKYSFISIDSPERDFYEKQVKAVKELSEVFGDEASQEAAKFLSMKNRLYAFTYENKKRITSEDVTDFKSKPLRKLLVSYAPKKFKRKGVKNYRVEHVGFEDTDRGFAVMGYTKRKQDVLDGKKTPNLVYFATGESKILRYIYDGDETIGKLKGVTFTGEPIYAPDIKSFGAYYIVTTLVDEYFKRNEVTPEMKIKALHLVALNELGLYDQVAKQLGIDFDLDKIDTFQLEARDIVRDADVSEQASLLSGGFFVPYVTYRPNKSFGAVRYDEDNDSTKFAMLDDLSEAIKEHFSIISEFTNTTIIDI